MVDSVSGSPLVAHGAESRGPLFSPRLLYSHHHSPTISSTASGMESPLMVCYCTLEIDDMFLVVDASVCRRVGCGRLVLFMRLLRHSLLQSTSAVGLCEQLGMPPHVANGMLSALHALRTNGLCQWAATPSQGNPIGAAGISIGPGIPGGNSMSGLSSPMPV